MSRLIKRFLTGLLALCLVLPASAAGNGLTLRYQEVGSGVRLTLEGLEREAYALQLELTLEGAQSGVKFDPYPENVYVPDSHVETDRSGTRVTIYMVAEEDSFPLSGKSLRLGTLACEGRLPSEAELTLLDRHAAVIGNGTVRVPLAKGGETAEELYRVQIAGSDHGSVTARPAGAEEGETVTLNAAPEAGYTLSAITVRDSRNREVNLTKDGLNRYTFSMPALDVEVTASFAPGGGLAFQDVLPGDWCYDAVRYVFEAGLMNGTSATTFAPGAPTTRGQIVAILYRLEGSPAAGLSQFTDVAAEAYYASAVSWASANGIVNGYSDHTFRPNNLITREQMAAFLYRYASYKGRNVSGRADLSVFADAGQIASYAVEPLRWANAAGLVNGVTANTLSPAGNATRAQVAVILSRFAQKIL